MNTKLMLSVVAGLLFAQISHAYDWKVHNYTPFEIKAKFDVVGKDHTITIPSGETKKYSSGALLVRGVKIFGIKSMLGNTYFGGNSDAAIITDDWGAGKAFGTTLNIFLENMIETKVQMTGTSGTFSFTPKQQRFILVRESFGVQGSNVVESTWFDPAGAQIATNKDKDKKQK